MYVWCPELFDGRKLRVDMETQSNICFGSTVVDVHNRSDRPANVFVCEKVNDFTTFWDTLFESI